MKTSNRYATATVSVTGISASSLRRALNEAAIAIRAQGIQIELDSGFNIKIGPEYIGSIKPLFSQENSEFIQVIAEKEMLDAGVYPIPIFFWAICQKILGKQYCILVDNEGNVITNIVGWVFNEFGFDADSDRMAVKLGLKPDLSNIDCARF